MKASVSTFGAARDERVGSSDAMDALVWQDSLIAVLADGAGEGGAAREAALKVVTDFVTFFKSRPRSWSTRKALEEFARLINRTLHNESIARFGAPEMISTVCVVVVEGDKLTGLNVGDSRAYVLHSAGLVQLSSDHVVAHPDLEHVLTRAMGMEPDVQPHAFEHTVAPGDILLLCSDGASRVLDAEALRQILMRRLGARSLVSAACEGVTPETLDDASAVVIELNELGPRAQRHAARLEIPAALAAGQTVDGFTLKQPFKDNERIWIGTRDGGPFVLKFAPLAAREHDAIHSQFVREMWTATRLEADCFVRAFLPENQRVLCYAMEYHAAPTLRHFVEERPLSPEEAVELGRFLLDAAQHLERLDLAHGDLKPENILVLRRGESLAFKLIDFGSIAELFSVTSRAGTPSFLAPERLRGEPLCERTEVFAIGVTLFHALTRTYPYGEIEPFQNPSFQSARVPSRLNSLIPPWLEAVLLRAVAVDPERRYQHFSEMKFDLENPAKVKPFHTPGAPLLERNPLLFYKTGFFLLLVLVAYLLYKAALAPGAK
jgi:serine/threonine protein kinase